MPSRLLPVALLAVTLAGCSPAAPPPAPPAEDDPAITAAIDSLLEVAMAGAAAADANRVLSIAEGAPGFTFVTGDAMVSGLDAAMANFTRTYAGIQSQVQQVVSKRVRVLTPDVAVLMATAEGAYMDKAGTVSEPIGIGLTVVFVRQGGRWVAEHAHQSFVP